MAGSDTKTLKVVVLGDSTQAQRALTNLGGSADGVKTHFSAAQEFLTGVMRNVATDVMDAGKEIIKFGFNAASSLQQATVAFTHMLGSGKLAKSFLDELQAFAEKTPFEFKDLTVTAQRLMAMGIAAKDVIPDLTGIGDAAAAMGGSQELVDQMTSALGQMAAKGHISGMEIKRMAEAGVPALRILADSYGVSTTQMDKMVSAGKVISSDAIPKLIAGMEKGTKSVKGFGGMMDVQSKTMAGAISNMKDSVEAGLADLFQGALPGVTSGIQKLTALSSSFFEGLKGDAKATDIGGQLGKGVREAGEWLVKLGADAKRVFQTDIIPAARSLWNVLGPLVMELMGLFAALWQKVQPLIPTLDQVGSAIKTVFGFVSANKGVFQTLLVAITAGVIAWKLWTGAIAAWGLVTKAATAIQGAFNVVMALNPVMLVVIAIAALAAGVIYAWYHFAGFRDFCITAWADIKGAALAVASWFMEWVWPTLKAVWTGISIAVEAFWFVAKPIFELLIAIVRGMVDFFMTFVWPVLKLVFEMIGFAIQTWWAVTSTVFSAVLTVARVLTDFFMAYVWPLLKFVFEMIAWNVGILWSVFKMNFDAIRWLVGVLVGWFMEYVWPSLHLALTLIGAGIDVLKDAFTKSFNLIRSAVETVMSAVVLSFTKTRDAVGTIWSKLSDLARVPINFVIGTVYNNGIAKLWNTVAGVIGAPKLPQLPLIPHAATGGPIPDVPGITGDWVPFYGMAGEYVLNHKQVANMGGYGGIEAFAGGHYADGGILGGLASAGSWITSKATSLVKGMLMSTLAPLISTVRTVINSGISGKDELSGLMRGVPNTLLDKALAWIKPKDVAVSGGWSGPITGDVQKVQEWLKGQAGKPYRWAEAGPGGYDCSGLVSAAWNLMHGRAPYNHTFSTIDEAPYFKLPGWGMFTAGWAQGGEKGGGRVGHTAGNLAGLGFESNGSHGVVIGNSAVSPASFAHMGHFDKGGILRTGWTAAYNGTGADEYVSRTADSGVNVTVNVTVQGNVTAEKSLATSIATEVRNELIRYANRNGGRSGLPANA